METANIHVIPTAAAQYAHNQYTYMPPASRIVSHVEVYAQRIPWYAWFIAGAYIIYRIFVKK